MVALLASNAPTNGRAPRRAKRRVPAGCRLRSAAMRSDAAPHSLLAFVPSADFARSTAFYRALGFDVEMDDDVRYCSAGSQGFLLQDFYVKDWANNFMLAMHVHDAQAWIDRARALQDDFPETRVQDPALEDWGMIVGHIWDPCGVLWHITQAPDAAASATEAP